MLDRRGTCTGSKNDADYKKFEESYYTQQNKGTFQIIILSHLEDQQHIYEVFLCCDAPFKWRRNILLCRTRITLATSNDDDDAGQQAQSEDASHPVNLPVRFEDPTDCGQPASSRASKRLKQVFTNMFAACHNVKQRQMPDAAFDYDLVCPDFISRNNPSKPTDMCSLDDGSGEPLKKPSGFTCSGGAASNLKEDEEGSECS
ncbi:hypothetical protein AJ78_08454 [Emergomyces pasteurianus Ep9510]|uniref:Uncharacterized protein n=1 Tax=Emergomyces pasteurianus Ep9510 TaxID=1447872 RepID=A0A1J9P2H7_9EURO|nr:hypothetical protein AJ78_08454 [Emergomyces pasteurianus Ep9510]